MAALVVAALIPVNHGPALSAAGPSGRGRSPQESEPERLRREGTTAFERSVAKLEGRREDLVRLRARYARDCTGRPQFQASTRSRTRSVDGDTVRKADLPECRALQEEVDTTVASIRRRLGEAEERARQLGVLPGTLRDIRRAHGLESGEFGR